MANYENRGVNYIVALSVGIGAFFGSLIGALVMFVILN